MSKLSFYKFSVIVDLREKSAQQAKAQQHVLGAANFLLLCTRLFTYANNKMVNVHVTNSYIYEFSSFSKLISLPYTLRAKSPSIFPDKSARQAGNFFLFSTYQGRSKGTLVAGVSPLLNQVSLSRGLLK